MYKGGTNWFITVGGIKEGFLCPDELRTFEAHGSAIKISSTNVVAAFLVALETYARKPISQTFMTELKNNSRRSLPAESGSDRLYGLLQPVEVFRDAMQGLIRIPGAL